MLNVVGGRAALGVVLYVFAMAAGPARAQTQPQPAVLPPDVLVFTNGDQLTGKLERGVGSSVVFKSDMAGEITVSLDKVKELRSSNGFVVIPKGGKLPRVGVEGDLQIANGMVVVGEHGTGAAQAVKVDRVAYIIDRTVFEREVARDPGVLAGWSGSVTGGATLLRSTTNASTYSLGVALVRMVPTVPYLPARNRTLANFQAAYGKLTTPDNPTAGLVFSEVKSNVVHADVERDQYVSPRLFALATASFDHNYAQGLSIQQLYGGGIGWTPVKTLKQQLDLKVDVHFEKQHFFAISPGATAAPDQNLIGLAISDTYRHTLPLKLLLTQSANVLPAFNNPSAYSANATVRLALPVYKRLAVQLSATDNYLNDPAPGFKRNSYQFLTGVTYTLR